MEFKKWLKEWEGNAFPGDDSQYYNSPAYPLSVYKGHGVPYGAPSFMSKVDAQYGLKPKIVLKKMKKKA